MTRIVDVPLGDYIYLIQERESYRCNDGIYKIGKTTQEPYKRAGQYPKSSILFCIIIVDDCNTAEKDLLDLFQSKYKWDSRIGDEYFEGDPIEMVKDILTYQSTHFSLDSLTNKSAARKELADDDGIEKKETKQKQTSDKEEEKEPKEEKPQKEVPLYIPPNKRAELKRQKEEENKTPVTKVRPPKKEMKEEGENKQTTAKKETSKPAKKEKEQKKNTKKQTKQTKKDKEPKKTRPKKDKSDTHTSINKLAAMLREQYPVYTNIEVDIYTTYTVGTRTAGITEIQILRNGECIKSIRPHVGTNPISKYERIAITDSQIVNKWRKVATKDITNYRIRYHTLRAYPIGDEIRYIKHDVYPVYENKPDDIGAEFDTDDEEYFDSYEEDIEYDDLEDDLEEEDYDEE